MSPPLLLAAVSTVSRLHTPHIDYLSILPILIMIGGAVAIVVVSSLVRRELRTGVGTALAILTSLGALGASLFQWVDVADHGAKVTVAGAVAYDGFSVFIQVTVSIAMLLTVLVGDGYLRREQVGGPELYVLALLSASGAMVMGSANDLIVIFLGLEIMSIALYVLAAFNHRRAESGEAALKYFILGSFSSAIFVYGIALVYGATGSTNLPEIADYLSKNVVASNGVLLAGLALLLVGFGFKIAAVPFHMWSPDVYQGAPSPVTGFMAAVAKAGAFAALLRVFVSSFGVERADWQPIVWALAILSLVVGAVLALSQRDVKRMLAYSSINQAGFILLGVQAADGRGVAASLYYVFVYTFMIIGTFAVVTVLARHGDRGHDLSEYRGLAKRQPLLAGALAILLLAQAGVPFTTGFLAKFQVVAAAVDAHSYALAAVAMASGAIAAFFYLRVAIAMYSPPGVLGDAVSHDPVGGAAADGAPSGSGSPIGGRAVDPIPTSARGGRDAGASAPSVAMLSLEVLTDEAPAPEVASRTVPVPALTAAALGLAVAFTVVFGIVPAPIVDFAHRATLLFL